MATSLPGPPPLSTPPPQPGSPGLLPDHPPLSALFLIDFDVKAGYTIVWKRSVPGIDLDGVVEYKSLPSGLHTVSEDLIYFVHDGGYAGLSAFVNARTDEEESRHSRMIAVGILVPFSYGRLGRAWRHAQSLKDIARKLSVDRTDTDTLQQYWENNGARRPASPDHIPQDAPLRSPSISFTPVRPVLKGHSRNRSASEAVVAHPSLGRLSPFHPAWSLTPLLRLFGPLIFPIHRAALLRKRILISTHAPVHEACNFVYNLSILSNIPSHVFDLLDPAAQVQRLKPLFTVGVHDIPSLLEYQAGPSATTRPGEGDDEGVPRLEESGAGWIACTTDSILAMKGDLWDMLITIPPAYSANAKEKVWPTVECPRGVPIKATQRDLRRFRSLQSGLGRLAASGGPSPSAATAANATSPTSTETNTTAEDLSPPASGIRLSTSSRPSAGPVGENPVSIGDDDDTDAIIEPPTWAALAYGGFMWWASAGEQRRAEDAEEQARDASLLAELGAPGQPTMQGSAPSIGSPRPSGGGGGGGGSIGLADSWSSLTARRSTVSGEGGREGDREPATTELAVIAYFHRLTTQMLSVLAEIVETSDEDDDLLDDDADDVDITTGRDGEDEDEDNERTGLLRGIGSEDGARGGSVHIDSDALGHMGLDIWSKADSEFVRELTARYFARRAYVEGKGVEVCGVRVC